MSLRSLITRLLGGSQVIELCSYNSVKDIHQERFRSIERERFIRVWCEIAKVCNISPISMNKNDLISDLIPPRRLLGLIESDFRFENLEALINAERGQKAPPDFELKTVADILDYLLK